MVGPSLRDTWILLCDSEPCSFVSISAASMKFRGEGPNLSEAGRRSVGLWWISFCWMSKLDLDALLAMRRAVSSSCPLSSAIFALSSRASRSEGSVHFVYCISAPLASSLASAIISGGIDDESLSLSLSRGVPLSENSVLCFEAGELTSSGLSISFGISR